MFIDNDLIDLKRDLSKLTSKIIPLLESVNWLSADFDRSEVSLKEGRLCMLSYPIAKPEQLIPTKDRDIVVSSLGPLIKEVMTLFPGYKIVRGELVNLLPGKILTPHIDIYWFHKMSKRIHIPILSNPDSELTFEDRRYHLEVGKVYEINNRIVHSGYNKGNTNRIHLILDLMEQNLFKNAVYDKQNFLEVVE